MPAGSSPAGRETKISRLCLLNNIRLSSVEQERPSGCVVLMFSRLLDTCRLINQTSSVSVLSSQTLSVWLSVWLDVENARFFLLRLIASFCTIQYSQPVAQKCLKCKQIFHLLEYEATIQAVNDWITEAGWISVLCELYSVL